MDLTNIEINKQRKKERERGRSFKVPAPSSESVDAYPNEMTKKIAEEASEAVARISTRRALTKSIDEIKTPVEVKNQDKVKTPVEVKKTG